MMTIDEQIKEVVELHDRYAEIRYVDRSTCNSLEKLDMFNSNYKSALKKRRNVYEKYLDDMDLFEVAQTCVNIGDAYRIAKKFNKALEYAEEALDIYSSKRNENQEVFEMYYYEAYQLKATILMDIDVSNGKAPDIPLSMMEECMKWSNSHPTNDYADRFNGVSGIILQSYKHK